MREDYFKWNQEMPTTQSQCANCLSNETDEPAHCYFFPSGKPLAIRCNKMVCPHRTLSIWDGEDKNE